MTFLQVTAQLWDGFQTTLYLFFVVLVLSLPLGLVFSFGSMSRFAPLRWFTRFWVWAIRGTPLMLQIITVFYVPGLVFNTPMKDRMLACLVAFVINYAIYFSEIFRGGIESIPKGQYEAGQVLGMTRSQIFFKIVLLQVIKRILAPIGNEVINLVKDTSLARVIAVTEVLKSAQDIVNGHAIIWPLFYTAVFYLAAVGLIQIVLGLCERKLSYYKG